MRTLTYSVYVEGVSKAGSERAVAQAIAARYGVPVQSIRQRMEAGRFHVKVGVDLTTAQQLKSDLVKLGARCVIEGADGKIVFGTGGNDSSFESGLSAAIGNGADGGYEFAGLDAGQLSVESLDGKQADQDVAPSENRMVSEDAFRPPDEISEQVIEAEEIPERRLGVFGAGVAQPPVVQDGKFPNQAEAPKSKSKKTSRPSNPLQLLAERAEVRFSAGLFIALLVGFVAAHGVGRLQEGFYDEQDQLLRDEYASATTASIWETLPEIRKSVVHNKRNKQQSIAISSIGVWWVVSAFVLLLWFKLVPWNRIQARFSN